jgi:hypothetical protein
MQCAECQNLLSEFLDDDLTDRVRGDVDRHLGQCSGCATLRDDLARIIEASAELPLHTPSAQVWERIQAEIGGGNVVAGPASWWDRLQGRRFNLTVSGQQIFAAAAAVIIVAGALMTINVTAPGTLPRVDVNWNTLDSSHRAVVSTPLTTRLVEVDEVATLRNTVGEMARKVEQQQAQWSAELRTTYQKAMTEQDARIAAADKAYAADQSEANQAVLLAALRAKFQSLEDFAHAGEKPRK